MSWIPILWRYGKLIGAFLLVTTIVWLWKDYQHKIEENNRLQENYRQEIQKDSIGFSEVLLTKDEAIEELKYNRQDLVKKLEEQDIKLNRITRIVSQKNTYVNIDTTTYLLNKILKGIQENKPVIQAVSDSTDCHLVEANLHFDGKDLRLDVTKVGFTSMTDIVAHTEKVGFRFWKWFRKKKVTVTVLNSCGESESRIINVQKK